MPQVKLHAQKFEDMIARRGRGVYWERAMRCSCYNAYSGNPLPDCKACDGEGFVYDAPVYEDAILVMSLVNNKEYTPIGEYQMGDAIATIPFQKPTVVEGRTPPKQYVDVPMYWIGEHDLVTLMTSEFVSTQALYKGAWFRGTAPDTLGTNYVTEIIRVTQSDSASGVVTTYTPDVDYKLTGNVIEWIAGGQAPADQTFYTVMFKHNPTYTVYTDLPQPRDQDGQRLPRKVALRYKGVL